MFKPPWRDKPWARCVLAGVAGLTHAMAYPPVGVGFLIFPAVLMLLAALHGLEGSRARAVGFLYGLAAFGTGLSWLWNIFGWLSLVLWAVLAAFPALFAEMQWRAARRGWPGWAFAAFTAVNWSAWEFVRAEIFPLKFPWMTVGLAIGPDPLLPVHAVHLFDDGTPGREAGVIPTAFGNAGTPICFDCDYEGVVRRMTAAGADFIISPVMDATSWSARQHDQHAELFRIRACENRRWLFVAASSGISQAIDPRGRVHARLGALEQGVLTSRIHAAGGLTFYTRHGWRLPWAVLAGAITAWGFLLAWRNPTNIPPSS